MHVWRYQICSLEWVLHIYQLCFAQSINIKLIQVAIALQEMQVIQFYWKCTLEKGQEFCTLILKAGLCILDIHDSRINLKRVFLSGSTIMPLFCCLESNTVQLKMQDQSLGVHARASFFSFLCFFPPGCTSYLSLPVRIDFLMLQMTSLALKQ